MKKKILVIVPFPMTNAQLANRKEQSKKVILDENIELHNSIREIKQLWKTDNEKMELKLNKTKETLKAVRQSMYYHQKTSKDLRSKLKKTKDEFNSLRSKWYVRLFNLNSV